MKTHLHSCLAVAHALTLFTSAHAQVPAVSRSLFDPDGITPVNAGNDLVLATRCHAVASAATKLRAAPSPLSFVSHATTP